MEQSYWQSRWRKDNTGWHMHEVFPALKAYWNELNLSRDTAVLIPLCGKSLDIDWLIEQGHYVIGVDVAKKAIRSVIDRYNVPFAESSKGSFSCYKSNSLELWCGDFMKMRRGWIPAVDAIYDKAALIALPPEMRITYAKTIHSLLQPHTQILTNCFEYDQHEMSGPPFAVFREDLNKLFGEQFQINLLHTNSLFDDLTKFHQRGLKSYLNEKLYLLTQT